MKWIERCETASAAPRLRFRNLFCKRTIESASAKIFFIEARFDVENVLQDFFAMRTTTTHEFLIG
jgi:hypothetical protein